MDDDQRRLQPAHIFLSSVESGRDRFTQDGWFSTPPISHWRNNLTALSKRYNLYFIATEDAVAVYEPQFPFQTLGKTPKLVIPRTLAEQNAQGYLDGRKPHSINHLIVGDLGTEEILLLATDSGNIAAYQTKAIREAIKKNPFRFSDEGRSDFVGVRAFFAHWVHESAWGLALHTKARMLAVSANTPHNIRSEDRLAKITVFAFALSDTVKQSADSDIPGYETSDTAEQADWTVWEPRLKELPLTDRSRNYKIVLAGHDDNIPSITFVNSPEDTSGEWLVSTDIGGKMKLWRIWDQQCYRSWDFSDPHNQSEQISGTQIERGWSVLALDPASFRSTHTMEEFCGWSRAPRYHLHTETEESYNISNIVRDRTPGQHQLHPAFVEAMHSGSDGEQEQFSDSAWSEDDAIDSEHDGVRVDTDEEDNDLVENGDQSSNSIMIENESIRQADGQGLELDDGRSAAANVEEAWTVTMQEEDRSDTGTSSPSNDPIHMSEDSRQHWFQEAEEEERLVNSPDGIRPVTYVGTSGGVQEGRALLSPKSRYISHSDLSRAGETRRAVLKPINVPAVPTIHCSASHIRLLNLPFAKTPHFFCSQALKQILPPSIQHSAIVHMDRLNMTQYIPDLGIALLATQVGRCAICSLTRSGDKGTLGFRVDWIVPFKQQEIERLRPNAPLLGIAVGPVQGQEIYPEHGSASEPYENPDEDYEEYENGDDDEDAKDEDNSDLGAEGDYWGVDGLRNGVPTTFDANIVSLTEDSSSDSSVGEGRRSEGGNHKSSGKEKYMTEAASQAAKSGTNEEGPSSTSLKNDSPVRTRSWTKLKDDSTSTQLEGWKGIEQSRRYRLMLTYYDHTVLTYEIGRRSTSIGLGTRKNWRNRQGLFA